MEMILNWIGGATFILSIGNLNIAVDPVLCQKGTVQDYFWFKSERIEQPVYSEGDFENIDLWLITHNHEDHLDSIGLSKISSSSKVICNKNSADLVRESSATDVTVLSWNQAVEIDLKGYRIEIEAIPAIHGVSPLTALLAGKGNGYYVTITKGKEKVKIYITGDTVYKKKIINSLENKEIDLLIPNMGAAKQGSWIMTLTLNSKMLKKMMDELDPEVVIPVHYGTFEHYKEPAERIAEINDQRINMVEVGSKMKFKLNESNWQY
jgi:N-acyl-phosphatidylethanolamine-hydrolysing phospholipase D